MSKKSFRENARNTVASVFMSRSENNAVPPKNDEHNTHYTDNTHDAHYTHNTDNTHECIADNNHAVGKKDKRLNLLIPSSDLAQLRKIAFARQISVNHLICATMRDLIEKSGQEIDKYDLFYGQ